MPCVFACNCQKKILFPSEVLTWSLCLRTNPGSESWEKNLVFLKRHEYKQYFSAHFVAFSSRLALGLGIIPFFLFWSWHGWKLLKEEKESAWVSANKLKWTCFEEGLYCTFRNWKAALSLKPPFFPLHCGGGKTIRMSPFLEGSGDAIESLQGNQWPKTFYMSAWLASISERPG